MTKLLKMLLERTWLSFEEMWDGWDENSSLLILNLPGKIYLHVFNLKHFLLVSFLIFTQNFMDEILKIYWFDKKISRVENL